MTMKGKKRYTTAFLTEAEDGKEQHSSQEGKKKRNWEKESYKKSKNIMKIIPESESEDEEVCFVCLESYSRLREVWVQCWSCKSWAHQDCTPGGHVYTCNNCDSD